MPVQRTICGTPVVLRMPPRRFQALLGVIIFVVATLLLFGVRSPDDLPSLDEVSDAVKNPSELVGDFKDAAKDTFKSAVEKTGDFVEDHIAGTPAHKEPAQLNSNTTSSYGPIQWIRNYQWRLPFSKEVTVDENTAVLPPLKNRPMIYAYYEPVEGQDKKALEAENRLVLAWRRAWWAQGFKPQVLTRGDAEKHPQYDFVQRLRFGDIDASVETEFMRWLAWAKMGGGILTSWLALPMAGYDNPILSFLRKNEYPKLSKLDGLSDALFFGNKGVVNAAITKALEDRIFRNTTANHDKIVDLKKNGGAMLNILENADWKVEPKSFGIAYYSKNNIDTIYKSLADKLTNRTHVEGLDLLASLINSHLHLTFQNTYPEGIAVVKPLPEHTTALMYEAIDIARNLTQCPTSPIPKSCPPNKPKCTPCDPAKPKKLQLVPALKNSFSIYTIGTVPHPYTLTSLHYTRSKIDANFVRNQAVRNLWVDSATKPLIGEGNSTNKGVVLLKEIIAAPNSASNSLWLTAERVSQADIEWIFGFNLPDMASPDQNPSSPDEESELINFPRPGEPEPIEGVAVQEEDYVKRENERLRLARDALKQKNKLMGPVIQMVEQWNLADTEIWRFARAFSARRRQERKQWEEEEKKFAGSEKKAGVSDRWED